ncbi:hypothetical protein FIBSPDRAFT_890521 [Athelia psychrophila]|uniref:Retrotransposon Copia-like N-terminal domain-containing protein n=1 Tax=Athelia psychrophila TaxID=1759441 RepID=A0A166KQM5_9AGAM|nr:hypothetical protein FIBSPDRAFT_890521 [Fibularhizoctonia sp. CBS 109695]
MGSNLTTTCINTGTTTASVPAGGMASSASTASLNPNNPFTPHIAQVHPIREITITTAMINSLNNDPTFKPPDMTLNNYPEWSRSLIQICELNNISDYILGNIAEPAYDMDLNAENKAYWAFEANNMKIVAFIKVNISRLEKPFVTTSLAHDICRSPAEQMG